MMTAKFSTDEIIKATGGIPKYTVDVDIDAVFPGISTDTRTISTGEVFFALIGENHDAHDHLDEAASKGAALLVVSDSSKAPTCYEGTVLVVKDVQRAYQDLAAYYRKTLDPFVIAVTGSVGKTTMKDMIACILSKHARVWHTQGNLNNQIGLPRTILEAPEDTEILVLEMGLAYAGDIERLAEIALPDVSIITNIGLSHRENFDTDDGILRAKYEICAFLDEDGTLVIDAGGNAELDRLAAEGSREKGYGLVRIAMENTAAVETADYIVTKTRISEEDPGVTLFEIKTGHAGDAVPFAIPVPGSYAGVSAAMASAACRFAGVSLTDSAKALENLERTPHRLAPAIIGGVLIIDDTYNSSPDSAMSGLDYLVNVKAEARIAVLADMNELGDEAESIHRTIGAAAANMDIDRIYVYGEKARWIADGAEEEIGGQCEKIIYFGADDKETLIERLKEEVVEGRAIYIKGSRSMKMEEVVLALTEEGINGVV